jgi:replicative DNA helicase
MGQYLSPADIQSRQDYLTDLMQQRASLERSIEALQAELAADRFHPEEEFFDLIQQICYLRIDVAEKRFKTPREMAAALRSLAARAEAYAASLKLTDPWDDLELEAHRPAGMELPAAWGAGFKGIRLHAGLPTVLGGYSGFGKSRTACNLIVDQLHRGERVVVFSLEMTPGQLWSAIVALENYRRYSIAWSRGDVLVRVREKDSQVQAITEAFRDRLCVFDATGWSASQVARAYDSYCNQYEQDPALVVLDYLQIVAPDAGEDRRTQVIDTVNRITQKAKLTRAAWLLLSQTNRSSHRESRGRASDHSAFQESASIEQNAALTLTLGRPTVKIDGEERPDENQLEINVSKNRFGPLKKGIVQVEPKTGYLFDPAGGAKPQRLL